MGFLLHFSYMCKGIKGYFFVDSLNYDLLKLGEGYVVCMCVCVCVCVSEPEQEGSKNKLVH